MLEVWIGAVGGLAAAGIGAWATLWARRPRRSRLGIVDAFTSEAPPAQSPTTPSQTVGVVLADIDVPAQGMATEDPIVDVKLYNGGGEAVVVKRLTIELLWARRFAVLPDLLPYVDGSGPLMMIPSATYEMRLPEPEAAVGTRITLGVSHVLAAGTADRIHVRLVTDFPRNEIARFTEPGATFVYLLRLSFLHDVDDRLLTSRTLAVACPGNTIFVPTPDGLTRKIRRFRESVDAIRTAIDEEMTTRGLTPPDWVTCPPRRRADLPRRLPALDRRQPGERFWNPEEAVDRYLDEAELLCRQLAETLTPEMPDGLGDVIPTALDTLARIPALRVNQGAA